MPTPERLIGLRTNVFVSCPEGTFPPPNEKTTQGKISRYAGGISFTPIRVNEEGEVIYSNGRHIGHIESTHGSTDTFQEDRELQIKEVESKEYID